MNAEKEARTFNLYEILEADPCCTEEQLKRAYRKKALKLHPDKNVGREQADFIAVNDAYKILKDPYLRRFYNRHGDQGLEMFGGEGRFKLNFLEAKNSFLNFVLAVLTRPTLLTPVFLYFGLQFILFIAFFWMIDWQFAGWNASWTGIFCCLWIPLVSFGLVGLLFTGIFGTWYWLYCGRKPGQNEAELPEEQEKEVKSSLLASIFACLAVNLSMGAFIWCTVLLKEALEAGTPWNSSVWPLFWASCIIVAGRFIRFLLVRKNSRASLFKFARIIASGTAVILLFSALALGASRLILGLSSLAVIVLACSSEYLAYSGSIEKYRELFEEIERMSSDPIEAKQAKDKLASSVVLERVFRVLWSGSLLLQFCLFASHLVFGWPRTWTGTAAVFVFSAFIQVILFCLLIPLLLLVMDRLLPDISDKTLAELRTGAASEDFVVIDLPVKSIYSPGYALASYQRRLKGSK